jgi:hypothetical protein
VFNISGQPYSMASKMAQYSIPEEFYYEGILYTGVQCSPKMIDGARNLRLTPQDVIVATYPKSGMANDLWTLYMLYVISSA